MALPVLDVQVCGKLRNQHYKEAETIRLHMLAEVPQAYSLMLLLVEGRFSYDFKVAYSKSLRKKRVMACEATMRRGPGSNRLVCLSLIPPAACSCAAACKMQCWQCMH